MRIAFIGGREKNEFQLKSLAESGFEGHIVAEINTRKAGSRAAREADLLASLAFSQLHFARTREATPEGGAQTGAS